MSHDSERGIQRIKARAVLGSIFKPTQEQKTLVLGHDHPDLIIDSLQGIHLQSRAIRNKTNEFRREMTDTSGRKPNNAYITSAILILNFADQFREIADANLGKNDLLRFAFYFDYAEGFHQVLNTIHEVERGVNRGIGSSLEQTVATIQETAGLTVTDAQIAQAFLTENAIVNSGFPLLVEDRTGRLLIAETTKYHRGRESRMGGEASFLPILDRDFYGAGAKLAEILYRTTYPIVDTTPSP